jgi:hypothetical protein
MSKDMKEAGIGTEEAKDLELDEEARPVKKAGNTQIPEGAGTSHKKRKGTRKVG